MEERSENALKQMLSKEPTADNQYNKNSVIWIKILVEYHDQEEDGYK